MTIQKNLIGIGLICLLATVCYSNTLSVPFVFDDYVYIINNPATELFYEPFSIWAFSPQRFCPFFSFALNHEIHRLDVFGYHLLNLIIHVFCAITLFYFASLLFFLSFKEKPGDREKKSLYCWCLAIFTALLFTCHPIQTQAVTYVWQRSASLAALFYLCSMLFFLLGMGHETRNKGNYRFFLTLSFFSLLLAMSSKQSAATLPMALILLEVLFKRNIPLGKRLPRLLPFVFSLAFVPLLIVLWGDRQLYDLRNAIARHTPKDYLLTQFSVITEYLRLLIYPVGQNLDYDYPLALSFFTPRTFVSFLFLAVLLVSGCFAFRRDPIIAFGVIFFFLALSVESSVVPLSDVIFEHRVYLPSVGFFLVFVSISVKLFFTLRDSPPGRMGTHGKSLFAGALLILVVLAYGTIKRNGVWRSEESLWQDTYAKSPNKIRVIENLAMAKTNTGKWEEALRLYEKLISIAPTSWKNYNNMGILLGNEGQLERAREFFEKAASLAPEKAKVWINLGSYYEKKGLLADAEKCYLNGVRVQPAVTGSYLSLSSLYNKERKYDKTLRILSDFISTYRGAEDIYLMMGKTHLQTGNLAEAEKAARRALFLKPRSIQASNLLGIVLERKGMAKEAREAFERALIYNPFSVYTYLNLEVWIEKHEGKREALDFLVNAERILPNSHEISYRLGLLFLTQGMQEKARNYFTTALEKCRHHKRPCGQMDEIEQRIKALAKDDGP